MEKLRKATDEEWAAVAEQNRFLMEDFLQNSTELSPKTLKAYESNLRIWFVWVKDHLGNKSQTEIKPLDFKRFQNWLDSRGASSSDIANKRAAVSSLNNYIEIYYADEYPTFRNFINKSIKRPAKAFVHEKEPLTKAEFEHLVEVLEEKGDWEKVAYLRFTLDTGCRRAESRQLLKNVVEAEPMVKEKDGVKIVLYQTHPIRCKGAGKTGKVRKLLFGEETMKALKKWVEVRGDDDCQYMFTAKRDGVETQVSETTFNAWAEHTFTPIVGRRVHPHLFRESRATQAVVEDGKDIEAVRALLGHESSDTTRIYVIRDESEDADALFM